jgi:hypothetical protein
MDGVWVPPSAHVNMPERRFYRDPIKAASGIAGGGRCAVRHTQNDRSHRRETKWHEFANLTH